MKVTSFDDLLLEYRDLVKRPGEESSDHAQGSFIESLNKARIFLLWRPRDLFKSRSKRPPLEILYGDLFRTLPVEIICRDIA